MAKNQYIDFENKPEWLFEKFLETGLDKYIVELVDMINPWLFRMICRMVGNREAAKDILQDTWLLVLRSAKNYNSDKGSISAYFFTTAKREAIKWLKNNYVLVRDATDKIIINDYNIGKDELGNLLKSAVSKIRNNDIQNCIYLFYFAELRINEIAEIMQTNTQNIKNWLSRGREQIRIIINTNKEFSPILEIITIVIFMIIWNGQC